MQGTTPDNATVLFLDLQEQLIAGVRTTARHKLRRAAGALAKLATLHALPALLSSVPMGGDFLKSIRKTLDDPPLRARHFTSAFADPDLVAALAATDRKVLIVAGVASEIVVLRTTLDAIDAGYTVHVATDACGGFSERTEAAAWHRVAAAGAVLTSVITLAGELAGDLTSPSGMKTMEILFEAAGQ